MAGEARLDLCEACAADETALIEIYLSGHVQSAMPARVERSIVENTVAANLELAREHPSHLVFLKALVDGRIAGFAIARQRQDRRFSLEVVVCEAWLRRGIAKSLLIELNRRCFDLGVGETCAHILPTNVASIHLVLRLGFKPAGIATDGLMLEFVKSLP